MGWQAGSQPSVSAAQYASARFAYAHSLCPAHPTSELPLPGSSSPLPPAAARAGGPGGDRCRAVPSRLRFPPRPAALHAARALCGERGCQPEPGVQVGGWMREWANGRAGRRVLVLCGAPPHACRFALPAPCRSSCCARPTVPPSCTETLLLLPPLPHSLLCRLFRTMGLRHMFVGPPHPLVSGMVTRKDIITGGHHCWWARAGVGAAAAVLLLCYCCCAASVACMLVQLLPERSPSLWLPAQLLRCCRQCQAGAGAQGQRWAGG